YAAVDGRPGAGYPGGAVSSLFAPDPGRRPPVWGARRHAGEGPAVDRGGRHLPRAVGDRLHAVRAVHGPLVAAERSAAAGGSGRLAFIRSVLGREPGRSRPVAGPPRLRAAGFGRRSPAGGDADRHGAPVLRARPP